LVLQRIRSFAYGRDLKDFRQLSLPAGFLGFRRWAARDIEPILIWCDAQGLAKSTRAAGRLSAITNSCTALPFERLALRIKTRDINRLRDRGPR